MEDASARPAAAGSTRPAWKVADDRYVVAGNIRTRYWQVGDRGSTVVLLHGLGSFLDSWCLNVLPLAAEHRVLVPDLIGHGYTEKPRLSYSIDCFVTFLADFLGSLGVERTHLVGHSWGGAVALAYSVRHREQVNRLVLAGSSGLGPRVSPWLPILALPLLRRSSTLAGPRLIKLVGRRVICRPEMRKPDWVDMTCERLAIPETREVVRAVVRQHMRLRGVRPGVLEVIKDQLRRLQPPTLVVHGRNDWLVPASNLAFALQFNPQLQVRILERCGHELQYECADEFNSLVLDFLRDNE